jgi:hypothetical protein
MSPMLRDQEASASDCMGRQKCRDDMIGSRVRSSARFEPLAPSHFHSSGDGRTNPLVCWGSRLQTQNRSGSNEGHTRN